METENFDFIYSAISALRVRRVWQKKNGPQVTVEREIEVNSGALIDFSSVAQLQPIKRPRRPLGRRHEAQRPRLSHRSHPQCSPKMDLEKKHRLKKIAVMARLPREVEHF